MQGRAAKEPGATTQACLAVAGGHDDNDEDSSDEEFENLPIPAMTLRGDLAEDGELEEEQKEVVLAYILRQAKERPSASGPKRGAQTGAPEPHLWPTSVFDTRGDGRILGAHA